MIQFLSILPSYSEMENVHIRQLTAVKSTSSSPNQETLNAARMARDMGDPMQKRLRPVYHHLVR